LRKEYERACADGRDLAVDKGSSAAVNDVDHLFAVRVAMRWMHLAPCLNANEADRAILRVNVLFVHKPTQSAAWQIEFFRLGFVDGRDAHDAPRLALLRLLGFSRLVDARKNAPRQIFRR
jgi:hypothetical protein